MYENLETADNQENLKRVVIDPVSRVEGHGKVTLLLDENNKVKQARLHIVEFRGFERFYSRQTLLGVTCSGSASMRNLSS